MFKSLFFSKNVIPTERPKKRRGISILLLVMVIISSCSNKTFNTEKELLEYIKYEKNGYIHHKSVNGVDFTLLYKPTDLLVKQELGDLKDNQKIKILREKYNSQLYFNLRISKNNKEILNVVEKNKYSGMINKLAFGMNDRVHLFNSKKDTLELLDYIYPRMFGMSKSTSMLFIYNKEENKINNISLTFTIRDLGLSTGELKFKIPTKIIKDQIKIKL